MSSHGFRAPFKITGRGRIHRHHNHNTTFYWNPYTGTFDLLQEPFFCWNLWPEPLTGTSDWNLRPEPWTGTFAWNRLICWNLYLEPVSGTFSSSLVLEPFTGTLCGASNHPKPPAFSCWGTSRQTQQSLWHIKLRICKRNKHATYHAQISCWVRSQSLTCICNQHVLLVKKPDEIQIHIQHGTSQSVSISFPTNFQMEIDSSVFADPPSPPSLSKSASCSPIAQTTSLEGKPKAAAPTKRTMTNLSEWNKPMLNPNSYAVTRAKTNWSYLVPQNLLEPLLGTLTWNLTTFWNLHLEPLVGAWEPSGTWNP